METDNELEIEFVFTIYDSIITVNKLPPVYDVPIQQDDINTNEPSDEN